MNALFPKTREIDEAVMAEADALPLAFRKLRDLDEADLVLLDLEAVGSVTPSIKRIRDIHHRVAELLARGEKPVNVSRITGMCQSRISILKNDPAFKELLTFYQETVSAERVDVRKRMNTLSEMAISELTSRIEERPEEISTSTLVEISKMTLDRTGHAPVTKSINVSATISKEEADQLKAEASAGVKVLILSPEDRRARKCLLGSPGAASSEGEADAGATEGSDLREESSTAPQAAE